MFFQICRFEHAHCTTASPGFSVRLWVGTAFWIGLAYSFPSGDTTALVETRVLQEERDESIGTGQDSGRSRKGGTP